MRALDDYPHRRVLGTRWADNDIYGHVNNVQYYALFDTLINAYLITEGGLDINHGGVIRLRGSRHIEDGAGSRAGSGDPRGLGTGGGRKVGARHGGLGGRRRGVHDHHRQAACRAINGRSGAARQGGDNKKQ